MNRDIENLEKGFVVLFFYLRLCIDRIRLVISVLSLYFFSILFVQMLIEHCEFCDSFMDLVSLLLLY